MHNTNRNLGQDIRMQEYENGAMMLTDTHTNFSIYFTKKEKAALREALK